MDQEVIVYREREVVRGEGAEKERQNDERLNEIEERPLTEEEMILREMNVVEMPVKTELQTDGDYRDDFRTAKNDRASFVRDCKPLPSFLQPTFLQRYRAERGYRGKEMTPKESAARLNAKEKGLAEVEGAKLNSQTLEEKVEGVSLEVGVGEYIGETARTIGKVAKGVAKVIGKGAYYTGYIVAGGLMIATIIRKGPDSEEGEFLQNLALIVGLPGSAAGYLFMLSGGAYPSLYNPELAGKIFLAQLATNALSGAYEIVRHSVRKVKERKQAEFNKRKRGVYNKI